MTERTEFSSLMPEVAKHLLGEPNKSLSKPRELRFGSRGSLAVDIVKGTYFDHENDEGGGVLDLVRRERGLTNGQAVEFLRDEGIMPREPEKRSRIVATYDYHDADGGIVSQVVRFDPKDFRQRRPDGKGGWNWSVKGVQVVPYRLPDIRNSIANGRTIFVVEGEKDADAVAALSLTATCNAGGAGKWRTPHAAALKGAKRVVILPDNDPAGRKHANSVAASLTGLVDDVRIVALPDLPVKGDVSDWLAAGGTVDALKTLVADAAIFKASETSTRDGDWQAGLLLKENDQPFQNIGNVLHMMRHHPDWAGVFGYDDHAARRVLLQPIPGTNDTATPRDFRDSDAANGAAWFNRNKFPGIGAARVHEALATVAMERPFHPVRDYLDALAWDGRARLDTWLERLGGAVVTDATRAYISAVGTKTLIAAVARIMKPGSKVDTVLILEGKQGAGKSTALRMLAGVEHFGDALPDMAGKDARDYLRGKWIVELSELAGMNKSDVEQVKAFVTRQEERFRPAYGREEIAYPRQCIFCGTTNKSEFLRDETGNRRFWPVKVEGFDIDALKVERDQLWAEALHRYHDGEEWWLTGDLSHTAEQEQAARVVGDEWAEPIARYLSGHGEGYETTIRTVAEEALHIVAADLTPQSQNRIRAAMTVLGWAKSRREAGTGRTLFKRSGAA